MMWALSAARSSGRKGCVNSTVPKKLVSKVRFIESIESVLAAREVESTSVVDENVEVTELFLYLSS